jgi:hypothetical protein
MTLEAKGSTDNSSLGQSSTPMAANVSTGTNRRMRKYSHRRRWWHGLKCWTMRKCRHRRKCLILGLHIERTRAFLLVVVKIDSNLPGDPIRGIWNDLEHIPNNLFPVRRLRGRKWYWVNVFERIDFSRLVRFRFRVRTDMNKSRWRVQKRGWKIQKKWFAIIVLWTLNFPRGNLGKPVLNLSWIQIWDKGSSLK